MQKLIECVDLGFAFDDSPVISDVNISVEDKSAVGILGANGAGKSTLLKLLSGILYAKNGYVLLDNTDIKKIEPRERAKIISYVPQLPLYAFPFSVLEVVLLGRAPYVGRFEYEGARDREIALGSMETVGISHLKDRLITELSGGERQLVSLARALAQDPRIMILDEPATFLDIKHKTKIIEILRRLKEQREISIVTTTHDIFSGLGFFDRVMLLKNGRIIANGPVNEVISDENLSMVYDTPVTVKRENDATYVLPVN